MSVDHQGVGVSWECASAGHGNCHLGGCRCACHYRLGANEGKLAIDRVSTDINRVATPPMEDPMVAEMARPNKTSPPPGPTCPKCGSQGQEGDKFCRRDGSPIGQVFCGGCGVQASGGDVYCGGCGMALSEEIRVKGAPRRKRGRESDSGPGQITITNNNGHGDGQ